MAKQTKHEFQERAVLMIRGIFEAHLERGGPTAQEMFDSAKAKVIRSLELEIAEARAIDFDRFNRGYMPDVKPDTVFQPIDAGISERSALRDARNEVRQAARKAL